MNDSCEPEEPLIYDFNPNNLPTELLQAVGLATAAAAQTEHILGQFIGALLGIDDVDTEALTAHMAIPLKDQVIRTLAELKAPYVCEVDEIDALLDRARDAFSRRNVLVHNSFCIDPRSGAVMSLRSNARGSLQVTLSVVTVDEIQKEATAIYQVGMDIMSFMISRGLAPAQRTKPIPAPVTRGPKARTARQAAKRRD